MTLGFRSYCLKETWGVPLECLVTAEFLISGKIAFIGLQAQTGKSYVNISSFGWLNLSKLP